jgi:hypothetical protein
MNYATLASDLQTWTENFGTEFVAAIPEIVRKVEDRIFHAVQLPAWRVNATATATPSTRALTLPTDYISLSSLAVVSGSQVSTLLFRDATFIDEAWPDSTVTGVPRVYAFYDKTTVLLGPTPAAGNTIQIRYWAKPASIVTAGTSWLGDNAESVLFYGCLSDAYTYMKGDQELQARYRALHDEGLARLKELGEGKLKRDDFRVDRNRV